MTYSCGRWICVSTDVFKRPVNLSPQGSAGSSSVVYDVVLTGYTCATSRSSVFITVDLLGDSKEFGLATALISELSACERSRPPTAEAVFFKDRGVAKGAVPKGDSTADDGRGSTCAAPQAAAPLETGKTDRTVFRRLSQERTEAAKGSAPCLGARGTRGDAYTARTASLLGAAAPSIARDARARVRSVLANRGSVSTLVVAIEPSPRASKKTVATLAVTR